MLLALLATPTYSQSFVRLIDNNKTPNSANPVDSAHGLPVNVVGGSGGTVAVSSVPQPTGLSAANSTFANGTVADVAATVSFTAASQNWSILNTSTNGNTLYVVWSGTATTGAGNIALPAGVGYAYKSATAISSISIIGSAASTTYTVAAQ
jgi:hypothetical protein